MGLNDRYLPKADVRKINITPMQLEQKHIDVRSKDGSTATAKIELGSDPRLYSVSRAFVRVTLDGRSAEESAFDFFSAFQMARRDFEAEGFRFLCYGASLNVWPSGMLRDMGVGSKGYKLFEGRNTTFDDLVAIFDSGDDVIPSTVEEQLAYAKAWRRSVQQRGQSGLKRKWWKFWK
jgi:hypothetical protein